MAVNLALMVWKFQFLFWIDFPLKKIIIMHKLLEKKKKKKRGIKIHME